MNPTGVLRVAAALVALCSTDVAPGATGFASANVPPAYPGRALAPGAVVIAQMGLGLQSINGLNGDSAKGIHPHSLSNQQRLYFTRRLGLEEIPEKQGGGYLCYTRFGNGRDADIARLASVPGVRAFIFDGEFGSAGWSHLGQMEHLEHLECQSGGNAISDDDLQCLKDLPHLRSLILTNHSDLRNRFGDDSLRPLANMHRLYKLVLHSRRLSRDGVLHIKELKSLESLELRGEFGDETIRELQGLENLRELNLKGRFTDDSLTYLKELDKLESLTIVSDNLTGASLKQLKGLGSLKHLTFRGSRQSTDLSGLREWPALISLDLGSPSIDDKSLMTLGNPEKLKSLTLKHASISDEAVGSITELHSLEELNLQNTMITDHGLRYLTELKELRVLVLGHTTNGQTISHMGLRELAKLPKLTSLDILYVDLQSEEFDAIAAIPSLKFTFFNVKHPDILTYWHRLQETRPDIEKSSGRINVKQVRAALPSRSEIQVLNH